MPMEWLSKLTIGLGDPDTSIDETHWSAAEFKNSFLSSLETLQSFLCRHILPRLLWITFIYMAK